MKKANIFFSKKNSFHFLLINNIVVNAKFIITIQVILNF